MDLDALREALAQFEPPTPRAGIYPIFAAARAVLDSEEVWWCEEGRKEIKAAGHRTVSCHVGQANGTGHDECGRARVVRVRLLAEEK